jgi:isoquinoline 1-oxidoreductase alpha subunit
MERSKLPCPIALPSTARRAASRPNRARRCSGCCVASCGACTVHVDGQPTRACQTFVEDLGEAEITTIEGASGPVAEAVQGAWRELDVVQCGYCQSGQIMSAIGLLSETSKPSDADIDSYMSGNACRCATYHRIRAAIHHAAGKLEG